MDRGRSFGWVVAVAAVVIVASLVGAWQATRDPLPAMAAPERRAIYESNLRNLAESCERPPDVGANPGLLDFCRKQASLLELMSDCDEGCRARTARFTAAQPSK